jgi:hypothetical protein
MGGMVELNDWTMRKDGAPPQANLIACHLGAPCPTIYTMGTATAKMPRV